MFCREFGVKTVEFQAECQAAPNVLPGVWDQNGRIPGGMPGGAWKNAWILSKKELPSTLKAVLEIIYA